MKICNKLVELPVLAESGLPAGLLAQGRILRRLCPGLQKNVLFFCKKLELRVNLSRRPLLKTNTPAAARELIQRSAAVRKPCLQKIALIGAAGG